jgi:hypothetical protein
MQINGKILRAGFVCLLAWLLAANLPLLAQERFGEFHGVASDPSGAVLPNVTVTATNNTTGRVYTTKTGGDGAYIIRDVDPGRYTVRFEAQGFSRFEVPDVNLLVGRQLKVDASLTVGSLEQSVQVTEASPLIDTTGTTIEHNITAEEFDRLPKARSFQSLALASPSVNTGELEGGFQVNGASGAENQFNIDGVSTTSLINGKSRQNAVFEILQEVQVKTGGIDAEYGGALGGVISAITKSGGNAFHGDAHYYYSGSSLNSAPNRRLLMDPSSERFATHVQDTKWPDHNNEIGGSLGGYLIKNKLFFFSALSPTWRDREITYNLAGGDKLTINQDQSFHMLFNKVDFQPWQRVRSTFSWLWTPTKSKGSLPAFTAGPDSITGDLKGTQPRQNIGYFSPQTSYTGQVDVTLTNTAMLTIRGGRFWDNFKTTGIPAISAVEYANSATNLPFTIPVEMRQAALFNNTPRLRNTYFDLVTRTYVQLVGSKFGTFWGQHNIRGGWGFDKTVNKVDDAYPGGGYVRVFWNTALNTPLGPAQRGTYGYYEMNDTGTRGVTGGTMNHLFIQDQWRIVPRLTLTLGLRIENEKVPTFRRDIRDAAFEFGFGDKIAPRLGASFDLFGNGKVKIYGSWGRYYDWVKYELSRGTFGGDFWTVAYRGLETTDVFSLSGTNTPGRNLWGPGNAVRDRRVPAFDVVEPDLKPMGTDNMNAGVEFQVGANSTFRANYVHTNLLNTIEDLGVLDAGGNEVYIYANPGRGTATFVPANTGATTQRIPYPKPVRRYDAMELVYTKRFSRGFFASASYVLSRLYGNYAGIANSDEITSPSTGLASSQAQQPAGNIARQGGNANRSWDLDEILFDSRGNWDVQGRLATDRPHVFKLYGNKEFKWTDSNTTGVGLFFYLGSGTPLSTQVYTTNQIPIMVNGRGDMGRTPVLNHTDLLLSHNIRVSEGKELRFEFNALNVFNQQMGRNRFQWLNRGQGGAQGGSAIDLHNTDLYQGYDYISLINQTPDQRGTRGAYDPRFGLDDVFNPGFRGRFGVKFIF